MSHEVVPIDVAPMLISANEKFKLAKVFQGTLQSYLKEYPCELIALTKCLNKYYSGCHILWKLLSISFYLLWYYCEPATFIHTLVCSNFTMFVDVKWIFNHCCASVWVVWHTHTHQCEVFDKDKKILFHMCVCVKACVHGNRIRISQFDRVQLLIEKSYQN